MSLSLDPQTASSQHHWASNLIAAAFTCCWGSLLHLACRGQISRHFQNEPSRVIFCTKRNLKSRKPDKDTAFISKQQCFEDPLLPHSCCGPSPRVAEQKGQCVDAARENGHFGKLCSIPTPSLQHPWQLKSCDLISFCTDINRPAVQDIKRSWERKKEKSRGFCLKGCNSFISPAQIIEQFHCLRFIQWIENSVSSDWV